LAGHRPARVKPFNPNEQVSSDTDIYVCYLEGVDKSDCGNSREPIAEALEQASIFMTRHVASRGALSLTAASALETLSREGPVRLTALAAAAGISQPSMTELVHRLARQGLALRVDDPKDGRAALVGITDTGRALLDGRRRDRRERLAELLAALSSEEEATLTLAMQVSLPIIRRLIDNATNLTPSRTETA
jgi:DNA-binding MarR family transcriptional regulator